MDNFKEEKEKIANGYAWAHDTIGVDKETFATRNVPIERMVRVPIGEEIKTAVLFGLNCAVKKINDEFVDKAWKYLFNELHGETLNLRHINDFKKYMEGQIE